MSIGLQGIDGANPVGFLAALGCLGLASDALGPGARLSWCGPAPWRPELVVPTELDEEGLVEAIVSAHRQRDLDAELGWAADVMKLTRDELRELLETRLSMDDGRPAAMLAACAAELPLRRGADGFVPYTPFRVIPRVGRARFVDRARELSSGSNRTPEQIASALFEDWSYSKANNLRWDPRATVASRAYTAEAPTNFGPLAVPGAMLLAVAGLRFFPLMLAGGARACRGFNRDPRLLVWPIWRDPLSEQATRILLGLPEIYAPTPDADSLRRHGVIARLVARRQRLGDDDELLSWGEQRSTAPEAGFV